jgi:hypothetical protein
MKNRRQPDMFASRKPRAARRKPEGDRAVTKRDLRASLALFSPTGSGVLPVRESGDGGLGLEQVEEVSS